MTSNRTQRATWVRQQREALGWTQAQFAAALGVAPNAIWRWESDTVPVDRRTVLAIERLVHLTQRPLGGR